MYKLVVRKTVKTLTEKSESMDQMSIDRDVTVFNSSSLFIDELKVSGDSIFNIMTAWNKVCDLVTELYKLGYSVENGWFSASNHATIDTISVYEDVSQSFCHIAEGEYSFQLKKGMKGWYVINFRETADVKPSFVMKAHGVYEQDGWTSFLPVNNNIDGEILDVIRDAFPDYQWDERYM